MAADKACAVVLRDRGVLEILAFEHPLAGLQLVKGSVEPGESSGAAAVRELMEEAGIQATAKRNLGEWHSTITGHIWAFHECEVAQDLPDPLMSEPSDRWHHIFKDALSFLRETVT